MAEAVDQELDGCVGDVRSGGSKAWRVLTAAEKSRFRMLKRIFQKIFFSCREGGRAGQRQNDRPSLPCDLVRDAAGRSLVDEIIERSTHRRRTRCGKGIDRRYIHADISS